MVHASEVGLQHALRCLLWYVLGHEDDNLGQSYLALVSISRGLEMGNFCERVSSVEKQTNEQTNKLG